MRNLTSTGKWYKNDFYQKWYKAIPIAQQENLIDETGGTVQKNLYPMIVG